MTELERIEARIVDACTSIAADWGRPLTHLRAVRPSAGGSGGRTAGEGMPMPVGLSDARREAAERLYGWCRVLVEDRHVDTVAVNQADAPAMCRLLSTHAGWLSGHEAGPDMADELDAAAHRLHLAATPRERTWRIGPCPIEHPDPTDEDADPRPCGGEVRARLDDWGGAEGRCRRCGTTADVRWWSTRIEPDPLVTVRGLVDAALVEGAVVTEKAVRRLIERGRLHVVDTDARGRRLLDRSAALDVVTATRRAAS